MTVAETFQALTHVFNGITLLEPAYLQLVQYIFAWGVLYLLIRKFVFPKKTPTFSNIVVSEIHALVALVLALYVVDFKHPFVHIGEKTSRSQVRLLTLSLAYFIYDSICCELIEHDMANLLHHLCTILGLVVGVFQGTSGPELCLCLVLMELSNPFLHIRSLLKETQWKDTSIALINDMLFGASFFLCRLVAGPFVTYYTLISKTSSGIVKAGGVGIQIVSLFWFYKIVQVARYKANKRAKAAAAATKALQMKIQ